MPDDQIDIVMTTRNRLGCLKRTLEHLFERTRSPYALHVIDDGSEEANAAYLYNLHQQGLIHTLVLRGKRCGAMANLNMMRWSTFSDPFVFTDDDVLCPDVESDWLARGLAAMRAHPDVGVMALNHPGARRKAQGVEGEITTCLYVGGTFMFVRRAFIMGFAHSHFRGNFGMVPTMQRCNAARAAGLKVAYLTNTYCYHIGLVSEHTNKPTTARDIVPLDWGTLEPPEEWRK
jgi:glycosyltransferase involved in cell wall biosynthesis